MLAAVPADLAGPATVLTGARPDLGGPDTVFAPVPGDLAGPATMLSDVAGQDTRYAPIPHPMPPNRDAGEPTRVRPPAARRGPSEQLQLPEQRVDEPTRRPATADRRDRPATAGAPAYRPIAPVQDAVLRTSELVKVHGLGARAVVALDGVTMGVERGRFTAIMGASGSGKSTLLHCLAGLDKPTRGTVLLGETDLTRTTERKLTRLRRDRIGFVFQSYDLLPQLTVRQNIVLPLEVAGSKLDPQWLDTVLDALDLGGLLRQLPSQLSGGEQQRVAVARAVLPRPDVVLADEPTGALDAGTTREMVGFLRGSVDHLGQTVVMVTHDPLAAQHTDRALMLHEGQLIGEVAQPSAHGVLDALAALADAPLPDVDAQSAEPSARRSARRSGSRWSLRRRGARRD
jgi:putative ABC transport system ATP-binding protein